MRKLIQTPFHFLLLVIYPPISLLAHNIEEVNFPVGIRSIMVSLAMAWVIFGFIFLFSRSPSKAALLSSNLIILFFSYGHIYYLMRGASTFLSYFARHRFLFPIYIVFFSLVCIWVISRKNHFSRVTQFLNLLSIIAVILPSVQIGYYYIRSNNPPIEFSPNNQNSGLVLPENPPDIYYIILDAYSRDDILNDFYKIDNSNFLDGLRAMGFTVANCSQSNYAQTQLSLVSSLNLNYLDELGEYYSPENTSRIGLSELIKNNQTRRLLEELGYDTYAFETGFKTTEWDNATFYLTPSRNNINHLKINTGLTDFESMLLKNSAGLLVYDGALIFPKFFTPDFENPLRIHRDRILFVLSSLEKLPSQPNQKFVFAHLVIPHPPYVFGQGGEFTNFEVDADTGYQNQIIFINQQILNLVKNIINNSQTAPIIILQADHGGISTKPDSRVKILNAYYLPDGGDRYLYPAISPVNTFRVVFNSYFEGNFDLLEDVSYFSIYQKPYDYTIIIDNRPGCPGY